MISIRVSIDIWGEDPQEAGRTVEVMWNCGRNSLRANEMKANRTKNSNVFIRNLERVGRSLTGVIQNYQRRKSRNADHSEISDWNDMILRSQFYLIFCFFLSFSAAAFSTRERRAGFTAIQTLNLTEIRDQAIIAFASYCPVHLIQSWKCYWCSLPNGPVLTSPPSLHLHPHHTIFTTKSYLSFNLCLNNNFHVVSQNCPLHRFLSNPERFDSIFPGLRSCLPMKIGLIILIQLQRRDLVSFSA